MTADLEFDSDVRRRIYEYVEQHGAVDPEAIRDAVRVEPDRGGSKPPRSAVEATARLSREELFEHLRALADAGHLKEEDGELHVAMEAAPETVELDDGTPVTVRLAREDDSEGVRSVMGEIVAERTSIVAETLAEALDDEPVLRRTRRRSRVVFVATVGEADDDEEQGEDEDVSTGEPESGAEVVGWVHVDAPELEKLRHTAELTVGVRPEYRERGIGSRLLDRGVEWTAEQGYRKVYQAVPATNEAAVAFLEGQGWCVEATREDHYLVDGDFVDEVLLAAWVDE